jgi:hypothetical protein
MLRTATCFGVYQIKKTAKMPSFLFAEREGFEPTVGSSPTAVFKTAAINHSAISPWAKIESR